MRQLSCQNLLAAEGGALLRGLWPPFPLALAWGIKCLYVVVVLFKTCSVFNQFSKPAYFFRPYVSFLTVLWTAWSHMKDQISIKGWWHGRGRNMQLGGVNIDWKVSTLHALVLYHEAKWHQPLLSLWMLHTAPLTSFDEPAQHVCL